MRTVLVAVRALLCTLFHAEHRQREACFIGWSASSHEFESSAALVSWDLSSMLDTDAAKAFGADQRECVVYWYSIQ
jgi:hypothetical protein